MATSTTKFGLGRSPPAPSRRSYDESINEVTTLAFAGEPPRAATVSPRPVLVNLLELRKAGLQADEQAAERGLMALS